MLNEMYNISFLLILIWKIFVLLKVKEKDQKWNSCCFDLDTLFKSTPSWTNLCSVQHAALSAKFKCNNSIFKLYSLCGNTHAIHSGLKKKIQNKTKPLKHSLNNKQRIIMEKLLFLWLRTDRMDPKLALAYLDITVQLIHPS